MGHTTMREYASCLRDMAQGPAELRASLGVNQEEKPERIVVLKRPLVLIGVDAPEWLAQRMRWIIGGAGRRNWHMPPEPIPCYADDQCPAHGTGNCSNVRAAVQGGLGGPQ